MRVLKSAYPKYRELLDGLSNIYRRIISLNDFIHECEGSLLNHETRPEY